jgi:hypothetical protein
MIGPVDAPNITTRMGAFWSAFNDLPLSSDDVRSLRLRNDQVVSASVEVVPGGIKLTLSDRSFFFPQAVSGFLPSELFLNFRVQLLASGSGLLKPVPAKKTDQIFKEDSVGNSLVQRLFQRPDSAPHKALTSGQIEYALSRLLPENSQAREALTALRDSLPNLSQLSFEEFIKHVNYAAGSPETYIAKGLKWQESLREKIRKVLELAEYEAEVLGELADALDEMDSLAVKTHFIQGNSPNASVYYSFYLPFLDFSPVKLVIERQEKSGADSHSKNRWLVSVGVNDDFLGRNNLRALFDQLDSVELAMWIEKDWVLDAAQRKKDVLMSELGSLGISVTEFSLFQGEYQGDVKFSDGRTSGKIVDRTL